ncbi:hypothetical protein GJ496_009575 [Pomphorhynchus laevis]|nr:hypothetical protein GJ496_009575 [Pomphorhynchus laevis]
MVTTICGSNCRHPLVLNFTGDFELFGTPLGSVEFILRVVVDSYLPKLAADLNFVSEIEDSQIRYVLLRYPLNTRLIACVLDSLQKIIATHLDHNKRDQTSLPTISGGLDLRRTTDHSTSDFVASVVRVATVEGLPCSHFASFDSSFFGSTPRIQIRFNQFDRARCLAVARLHALAWLHVIRNEASRTALPSPQFCTLIHMWLVIPLTPSAYRCSRCYRHGDRYGFHALSCLFGGFGGAGHDAIRDVFFRADQRARMHVGSSSYRRNRDLPEPHLFTENDVLSFHRTNLGRRNLTSLTTETDLQETINEVVAENKGSFDFTKSLKMTGTKIREADSKEENCESFKVFIRTRTVSHQHPSYGES